MGLAITAGVVVVFGSGIESGVLQAANDHALKVLEAPSVDQAFRRILRLRPRVVIVQVAGLMDEGLRLVQRLATAPRPVPVIVVATSHSYGVERAVRRAGAAWYVPDASSPYMDQILRAITSQPSSNGHNRWGAQASGGRPRG